jgi:hypothetical protein
MKYIVNGVQNVPMISNKYIVARLVDGVLWYWGSWENFDDAFNASVELENGIVVERCDE